MSTTDSSATQTKSALTRAKILETALRLFDEKGYDQTTMRDIAAEAGMATGASYYYFRSKPEIVMAFYEQTSAQIEKHLPDRLKKLKSLKSRIQAVPEIWLEHFTPHREFLIALFRTTIDPQNPLSPFAVETRPIRQTAINWFELALADTTSSIPKDLRPYMPKILWLYQMGIILYWLHDNSPDQKRTRILLNGTIELLGMAVQLANLPLVSPIRRKITTLAQAVGIEEL